MRSTREYCVHASKDVTCANAGCYCVDMGLKCTNDCSCSADCCTNRRAKPAKDSSREYCVHAGKNVTCANASCYCVDKGLKCTKDCSCTADCCTNRRAKVQPTSQGEDRKCGICNLAGHIASNKKFHPDVDAFVPIPSQHVPVSPSKPPIVNEPRQARGIDIIDVKKLLGPNPKPRSVGTFGAAYKCVYDGAPVIVKVMKEEKLDSNDFIREVNIMIPLRHPNIVQILGYNNDPYSIVMVEAKYGSLWSVIQKVKSKGIMLSLPVSLDICHQMAAGLLYLHRKRVLHRDLKAENVLVDRGVELKLCDFGISRVRDATLYNAQSMAGTLAFMAPECFSNIYSCGTDVHAFAMTCWQFLAGVQPFERVDVHIIIKKIVDGERPDASLVACPEMRVLLGKCWNDPSADPSAKPPHPRLGQRPEMEAVEADLKEMMTTYPLKGREKAKLEKLLEK